MTALRVVIKASDVTGILPGTVVSWGDGHMDYLMDGKTPDDVPANAVYAAYLDDAGKYSDVIQAPASLVFKHHFAGWDSVDWPYPS